MQRTISDLTKKHSSASLIAILSLTPVLLLTSCSSPKLPLLPAATATNAPTYLPIQTYVAEPMGGSFVVHPSVVDFGATGWQTHRYWMAISTYPPNDNSREGPSIYFSEDGSVWTMPAGISNPIEAPDANWISSDPELFAGPDGQLICVWRDYNADYGATKIDSERLYYKVSSDGVHWSGRTLFLSTSGTSWHVFSPSVVYREKQFNIWTTNGNNILELRTGKSLTDLSDPVQCTFNHSFTAYHNSVRYFGNMFVAVIQNRSVSELRFAESWDGIHWAIGASPMLRLGPSGHWDDLWMYRADFAPNGSGGFDLWYSARGSAFPTAFRFGRTTITLNPPLSITTP
jgi:hypothetical protein